MAREKTKTDKRTRRTFTAEFKQQAVQMLLDGYSASSVSENLGIGNTTLIYRWKAELITKGGLVTETLDSELRELRNELRRTQRERDILSVFMLTFSSTALGILSQQE